MLLELSIKYGKNTGLVLSPQELLTQYFYGITIQAKDGTALSWDVHTGFILAAQQEIEHYLGIKLIKQIITEQFDFNLDTFLQWGYLEVGYPVAKAFEMVGWLGNVRQLVYPEQWLCSRKSNENYYYRRIFIVPAQNTQFNLSGQSLIYGGVLPFTGITSFRNIPNYFTVCYCTGFDKMPRDLLDVIGKLAAIGLFNIAGDIALGTAALSSYTLSIDGLTQSISTTNSATNAAFGARIINYQKEIQLSLDRLEGYYKRIVCTAM